jgi:prevent-host-death family protein
MKRLNARMTATLEQTQADLPRLLVRVQEGEEVVITREGRPVAKLTRVPQNHSSPDRQAWLDRLAELRQRLATDKTGPAVEQLLNEDRGE